MGGLWTDTRSEPRRYASSMNATPRWLTSEERAAWESFIHMQEKLIGRLSRRVQADSGVSASDYTVLVKLTETGGGRMRFMDLAKLVEWEKSRMSHQVRRMTKRGLVTKEDCPDDGRGNGLSRLLAVVALDAGCKLAASGRPR